MNVSILQTAYDTVRKAWGAVPPKAVAILGSGWTSVTRSFSVSQTLRYDTIPGLGVPGVQGHGGQLLIADHRGAPLLLFDGRRHWYEGVGWEPIAIPVYIARQAGARFLILANAAGAIREDLRPGDLMVIDDHINAMGVSPLTGPADGTWGTRFPDQHAVYDPALRRTIDDAARETGIRVQHGVYAALSGPAYETPAEVRMLRSWGADAVGMSTVPEAMLGNAVGLAVAGLSCIANASAGPAHVLSHTEVTRTVESALPGLSVLLARVLDRLATP